MNGLSNAANSPAVFPCINVVPVAYCSSQELTIGTLWRQSWKRSSVIILMAHRDTSGSRAFRGLALTLAVLCILFLTQIASHSHTEGQTEDTCPVCHAAHFRPSPIATPQCLVGRFVAVGYVAPFVAVFYQEIFSHDFSGRAPPTL